MVESQSLRDNNKQMLEGLVMCNLLSCSLIMSLTEAQLCNKRLLCKAQTFPESLSSASSATSTGASSARAVFLHLARFDFPGKCSRLSLFMINQPTSTRKAAVVLQQASLPSRLLEYTPSYACSPSAFSDSSCRSTWHACSTDRAAACNYAPGSCRICIASPSMFILCI